MQYRGELFKGRCQGGLSEGKVNRYVAFYSCMEPLSYAWDKRLSWSHSFLSQGRLVFGDGSIYDGMWHKGKRCGLGTFYFKNGDVFQGTWSEDLIHGKVNTYSLIFCIWMSLLRTNLCTNKYLRQPKWLLFWHKQKILYHEAISSHNWV